MAYTPKDWSLNDPITEVDLDHIENGIGDVVDDLAELTTLTSIAPGVALTGNRTATVTANLAVYVRPHTPYIIVADVTPAINGRLVILGHLTFNHSAAGTPTLSCALTNAAGATLVHGPSMTRIASATADVALPICMSIDLTASAQTVVHLAVSSSVAGTVTLLAYRCRLTAVVLPR